MKSKKIKVDKLEWIVFGGKGDIEERKIIKEIYKRKREGKI